MRKIYKQNNFQQTAGVATEMAVFRWRAGVGGKHGVLEHKRGEQINLQCELH